LRSLLIKADNAAMKAEPPKAGPPKRKRRCFQFSLRTLLIFTFLVAVPCAWLGSKIERKRREREAVKVIAEFGGRAYYDYQFNGDPEDPQWSVDAEPSAPGWLRRWLGDDFLVR
jgi:hypothetical protein